MFWLFSFFLFHKVLIFQHLQFSFVECNYGTCDSLLEGFHCFVIPIFVTLIFLINIKFFLLHFRFWVINFSELMQWLFLKKPGWISKNTCSCQLHWFLRNVGICSSLKEGGKKKGKTKQTSAPLSHRIVSNLEVAFYA